MQVGSAGSRVRKVWKMGCPLTTVRSPGMTGECCGNAAVVRATLSVEDTSLKLVGEIQRVLD